MKVHDILRIVPVVAMVLHGASASAVTPVLAAGTHASGGISAEGRQEMLAKKDLYNVRLTFAEAGTGAYVAGVTVRLESTDRKGVSFGPFADCGPLFYVALRPGLYRVSASYAGVTRQVDVRAGAGAVHAVLHWPAASEP
ncbi:hypothetical protein WKW79_20125 [Variovorax robiniae]|uniref:Carboxypeptidase regulatory-like domain-containing protein n=1 Tax=Variovorax robiniae TaxID=1836199 RepID=A0ABU8XAN1_9BURK